MEVDKTVQELMQKPKEDHESGALDVIHARRKQLADIFFAKSKTPDERNKVFDELIAIHKYFGMATIFKVKTAKGFSKPVRTREQKKVDSVNMMRDLWPEAQKFALECVKKEETGMPTTKGAIIVDKNHKERSILAQVFLYSMVELYKQ